MARKVKISHERLKRFAREEKTRKENIRNKRKYYLIVCEGEATEPHYFDALKQDLPKGVLTAYQIDIAGTGRNTQSLLEEALRLKNEYRKNYNRLVDRLWVVFDRDSFDPSDFNNAILRCKNNKPEIGCAWSNEAFELWYLLHFQYYENAMSRMDFKDLIEKNLKPILGEGFRYEKNSNQMYKLLSEHGRQEDAFRNAKRLAKQYGNRQDYANHNPCTMVWKLVEELIKLKS
ncbi:MAG: RloB family protein [Bacteroidia bacterium]|nr:RloB family protein [Bacteroidia bacterium]